MRARDVAPASCRQRLLRDRSRLEACAAKSESAFEVRQLSCRLNDSRMNANRKSGSPAPALQNVGAPTCPLRFTNPSFRAKRGIPLRSTQERFLTPQTPFGMTPWCMTGRKNVGAPTFPNRNWVLWSAGACSRLRCEHWYANVWLGGTVVSAKAAASRRTPKCRRADIPITG